MKLSLDTQEVKSTGQCCMNKVQSMDENGNCIACPENSLPRLNGYFCESCPAGFGVRDPGAGSHFLSSYGCHLCPVDTFKAKDGIGKCQSCGPDATTSGTVGATFCIWKWCPVRAVDWNGFSYVFDVKVIKPLFLIHDSVSILFSDFDPLWLTC